MTSKEYGCPWHWFGGTLCERWLATARGLQSGAE